MKRPLEFLRKEQIHSRRSQVDSGPLLDFFILAFCVFPAFLGAQLNSLWVTGAVFKKNWENLNP